MGLQLDSKTINLERRYMGLAVNKLTNGLVQSAVTVQLGYYDEGQWVAVKSETIALDNDATALLFGHKATHLALSNPKLVDFMDKIIYGVINEDIAIKTKLSVICNVIADVVVKRQGVYVTSNLAGTPIECGVILGASVEVSAAGYITQTFNYPVLNGTKELVVTLEQKPIETADATS